MNSLNFLRRKFYHKYVQYKFNTIRNSIKNYFKYDAPADPYKKIWIDTQSIHYRNRAIPCNREGGMAQVRTGNWDAPENCTPVGENYIIKSLRERYEEGASWEETAYYERAKQKLAEDNRDQYRGATNIQEFIKGQCAYVDGLYHDIKHNGYKNASKEPRGNKKRFRYGYNQALEVLVSIDRKGKIMLFDGHHRFAIAQILGLHIPVQVVCRHKQWQRVRDEIYNSTTEQLTHREYGDHPDLEDVLNK